MCQGRKATIYRSHCTRKEIVMFRTKFILVFPLLVMLLSDSSRAERKRYDGYRVIRLETSTEKNEEITEVLRRYSLDIWRRPSPAMRSYDVMISPHDWDEVTKALDNVAAKYRTTIPNVQQLIDDEGATRSSRRSKRHGRRFSFKRYHPLEEIRRWMHNFARANRDIVKMRQVGVSYQGRRIMALQIGVPSTNSTKRILWQDAVIHAREWVTGASLILVARKLVKGYRERNSEIIEFLQRLDWYILPVWNVDGYKYSWTKDRMWRKSRSTIGSFGCFGVDLNRNFQTPNRGQGTANDNPCSEVYHGPSVFSEIESSSLRQYLLYLKPQLAAVLTLHSYAQYWLYPYGYTYRTSADHEDLENLSIEAVSAIQKKHGTVYKQGTVSALAYQVSGGSIDWSYMSLCVKYTFGVELRDTGMYGFVLPSSLILPTAEEYFEGVKVVARRIMGESEEGLTSTVCRENNQRG